jgi:hypothetical protein
VDPHASDVLRAASRNTRLACAVVVDGRPKYILAGLAGVPPNVFGGIISGRVVPSVSAKARIAEVLNMSVVDLFDNDTDPEHVARLVAELRGDRPNFPTEDVLAAAAAVLRAASQEVHDHDAA